MSRSKKIFSLIEPKLPGIVLCGDMLVVCPTEHIVRGFLLETTTERDHVYLWRVVTPLHRPMEHVFLNYSDRIFADNKHEKFFIDRSSYRESADIVYATIIEHISFLEKIRQPNDFLEHIARRSGSKSIVIRLDFALAHCRIGNMREASEIIAALDDDIAELDEKSRNHFEPLVSQIMHSIDSGPSRAISLLDEWENVNVEKLKLRLSRSPFCGPRLVKST